jgi:hypothetical protein
MGYLSAHIDQLAPDSADPLHDRDAGGALAWIAAYCQIHKLDQIVDAANAFVGSHKRWANISPDFNLRPHRSEGGCVMAEDATPLVEAMLAIIDAARAYLPPDGIGKDEFIARVLETTDNPRIIAALAAHGHSVAGKAARPA